jgi:hypothetical protein
MQLLAFFALASIGHISIQAQPTFQRIYLGSGGGQLSMLDNGNILSRMTYQNGFSVLDTQGQIVLSRSYSIDSLLGIASIRPYSDEQLAFVSGSRKDSCSHFGPLTTPYTYPTIGKMDMSGNIQAAEYYQLNTSRCWGYPMDLLVSDTKDIITWGLNPAFFALRVDSALAPVWSKQFEHRGSFQFIKELPGGDLLAGINTDTAGAVVARLDAFGNFLWCKSYIRPRGFIHDAVIESDGSFIITGLTDSTASTNGFIPLPSSFQPKLFIMKLDGTGAVQWCKGFDSSPNLWYSQSPSRIVKTQAGNYTLLATTGVHIGGLNYNLFDRPVLINVDENGDTLWTRSVSVQGYTMLALDLLHRPDGGYVFDGLIWGTLPNNNTGATYIFNADSDGHFSCREEHLPLQIMDLFPVDSNLILASVDGTSAHQAHVNDITYPAILEYDACVITDIDQPTRDHRNRPVVRPNPNTGRFTMQFQDPLIAESYYSLFDTMGKLLLQRPLPTGATLQEVDLTRFGAGSYVIKFTSPEGVCYERVVVE